MDAPIPGALRETLVTLEWEAWEAWKRKDAAFYRRALLDDAACVSGSGVSTREAIVRQVETATLPWTSARSATRRCARSPGVALLTLRATSDLTCGSRAIHSGAWVWTLFVHDGNDWRIAFHQETDTPQR